MAVTEPPIPTPDAKVAAVLDDRRSAVATHDMLLIVPLPMDLKTVAELLRMIGRHFPKAVIANLTPDGGRYLEVWNPRS